MRRPDGSRPVQGRWDGSQTRPFHHTSPYANTGRRPRSQRCRCRYFYYLGTTPPAVRSAKWKLRLEKKKAELFDLEADVSEFKNLADQQPGLAKKQTGLIKKFDDDLKSNKRPAAQSGS